MVGIKIKGNKIAAKPIIQNKEFFSDLIEKQRAEIEDLNFEKQVLVLDLDDAYKLQSNVLEHNDKLDNENAELKKTNCVLRNRLQEAERDTSETKLELEMIEDMVKSINEHSKQEAFAPSVSPRQVPSAITALNILKTNHDSGLSTLNKEVKKLKESEENKTNELERLRHSLQDYSKWSFTPHIPNI